jgi:hypothetical protein
MSASALGAMMKTNNSGVKDIPERKVGEGKKK